MAKSQADIPLFVGIIGALTAFFGIILILVSCIVIFALHMAEVSMIYGAVVTIVGVVMLITGYGFLKGWSIMWYAGVVIYALHVIGGLFILPFGVVPILIGAAFLYYLFRQNVKEFFLGGKDD